MPRISDLWFERAVVFSRKIIALLLLFPTAGRIPHRDLWGEWPSVASCISAFLISNTGALSKHTSSTSQWQDAGI